MGGGFIGLPQGLAVEHVDVERRFLRQGQGVVYSCLAPWGAIVHHEQARPTPPPGRFLRRCCDHEEGWSGRAGELLDEVAQHPTAPPRAGVRPDYDQIAVCFLGGAQDHVSWIPPAHTRGRRDARVLGGGRSLCQNDRALRHDTLHNERTCRDVWRASDEREAEHRQDGQLRPGISRQRDGLLAWGILPRLSTWNDHNAAVHTRSSNLRIRQLMQPHCFPCQTAAVAGTCQRGERHLQEVRKRGKMADAAASRAPAGPWTTAATMVLGSFVAAMAVGIVNMAMSQMIGIS